jgi:hypothetical protein
MTGFHTKGIEKLQFIQNFLLRRKEWEKEIQDEIRELQQLAVSKG